MEIVLLSEKEDPLSQFFHRNLEERCFASRISACPLFVADRRRRIPPLPEGSTLVVDAENPFLPLENAGVQVLTCGLSPKDTFTFSSRGEESAVVSLMRAVTAPSGTVEPMEIPIAFPGGTEDFLLLSITAARLFAGELENRMENGKLILYN